MFCFLGLVSAYLEAFGSWTWDFYGQNETVTSQAALFSSSGVSVGSFDLLRLNDRTLLAYFYSTMRIYPTLGFTASPGGLLARFDCSVLAAGSGVSAVYGGWNLSFIWQHPAFPFLASVHNYYYGPGYRDYASPQLESDAPLQNAAGLAFGWQGLQIPVSEKRKFPVLVTLGSAGGPVVVTVTPTSPSGDLSTAYSLTGKVTSGAANEQWNIWMDIDGQGALTRLFNSQAPAVDFAIEVPPLSVGPHTVRVYAIGSKGSIGFSDVSVTVAGPIASPGASPGATVTPSADLGIEIVFPPDGYYNPNYNFQLRGALPSGESFPLLVEVDGYDVVPKGLAFISRYVAGQYDRITPERPATNVYYVGGEPVTYIYCRVGYRTLSDNALVLVFTVTNPSPSDLTFERIGVSGQTVLGFAAQALLDGQTVLAGELYPLQGVGITALFEAASARFPFVLVGEGSGLVTPGLNYWFGPPSEGVPAAWDDFYSDSTDKGTSFQAYWPGGTVSSGSVLTYSMIMRFGYPPASTPSISLTSPAAVDSVADFPTLVFQGIVTGSAPLRVLYVVNQDVVNSVFLNQSFTTGANWRLDFSLSASFVGTFRIDFYAVTGQGVVSAPVSFSTTVIPARSPSPAATASPVFSPRPTVSRSALPTPLAALPMSVQEVAYDSYASILGEIGPHYFVGLSARAMAAVLADWPMGLSVSLTMVAAGPLAVLTARVVNSLAVDLSDTVSVEPWGAYNGVEAFLYDPNDYVPVTPTESAIDFYNLSDTASTGFYGRWREYRLNVYARDHPLVDDVSSYEYSQEIYRLSWGVTVPAGSTITRQAVFSWSVFDPTDSSISISLVGPTSFPVVSGDVFQLTGTVDWDNETAAAVLVLIDGAATATGQVSPDALFTLSISTAGLPLGLRRLAVYAVDGLGHISVPPAAVEVTIVAPTVTVRPRTNSVPSLTPVPSLRDVGISLVSGSQTNQANFDIVFTGASASTSKSGYKTRLVVEGIDVDGYAVSLQELTVEGVKLTTLSSPYGSDGRSLLVTFNVKNTRTAPATVDVIVTAGLENEGLPLQITNYADLRGFTVESAWSSFDVLARFPVIISPADSYWFGDALQLESNSWSLQIYSQWATTSDLALSIGWLRRVVAPSAAVNFSVLFRSGRFTVPTLSAALPDVFQYGPGRLLHLTGTTIGATSLLVMFDGELVASFVDSLSPFTLDLDISSYLGNKELSVRTPLSLYAIDAQGGVSSPVSTVILPPAPKTAVPPTPGATASPAVTVDPKVTVTCDGLNYTMSATKLTVDGPGTVTRTCVLQVAHLGLETVQVGADVLAIGNDAFAGQLGLFQVWLPTGLQSIGNGAFEGCSKINSVTLPQSLVYIGSRAFASTGLESVTVPGSVRVDNFASDAFYDCPLSAFSIIGSSTQLRVEADVLYSADNATLVAYPPARAASYFVVPESVTAIAPYAFALASNLFSVSLPSNLSAIGDYAFEGCSLLSSLPIPGAVTDIGHGAFQGCSALTFLRFPASLETLGMQVFLGSGVSTVVVNGSTSVSYDESTGHNTFDSDDLQQLYIAGTALLSICKVVPHLLAVGKNVSATTAICNGLLGVQITSAFPGDPPPPITPTALPSRSRSPSESRLPTPDRSVAPIAIVVTGDELLPDALIQNAPVEIFGVGELKAINNLPLRVADLIVAPSAQIVATALVVEAVLNLKGNCSLSAAEGSKITLRETVALRFSAETVDEIPVLDLGDIGTDYDVVPQGGLTLQVTLQGKLEERRLLVRGRTLDNCDQWIPKLTLDPSLIGVCDEVDPEDEAARVIRAGRLQDDSDLRKTIGLFVDNRPPGATKKPDNTVVIVVVVVVVVLVVIGAAVGIFLFLKKKGSAASSSSSPDSISA